MDENSDDEKNEIFMNGVKRRAVDPPSVETVTGGRRPNNVQAVNPPAAVPVVKKKTVRRRVQRYPVNIKKKKIWSKLLSVDAGISIGEWVYHDDEAANEIINGIRHLREVKREEKKKKRRAAATLRNNNVIDGDTTNINNNAMDIDSPAAIINEVLVEDEYYSAGSSSFSSRGDYDDEGYTISDTEENVSIISASAYSTNDSTDGLELDDTESVYKYPYNLEEMKTSSPLRGVVTVNGIQFKAYFDTGASVSIIGSNLVKRLGLVPNGDKLKLVGFNASKGPMHSNIVMDVPVSINGKIRPEHMCVDESDDSNLCLLGLPWFKNYGITLDPQRSLVNVPTTDGIMKIKVHSKQYDEYNRTGLKAKKIYQVQSEQKFTNNFIDDLLEKEYDEDRVPTKINGVLGEIAYDESNICVGVREELKEVIEKYKNCFSEISGLSKIKGYQMDIYLKENFVPVRNAPYRLSWSDQDILESYVQEMLDLDLIEKSMGTWTSSLFLIDKKEGGSKRVVVDLRKANEQIVKTNYPVATVSELTEATSTAKIFSAFDATSGYFQLEINPEHREITGFITKSGTYRYKVCPQGITTGVPEYSRVICDIFKDYVGLFVYSFLDDILVFSDNVEDHAKHLELVFQACERSNLKLKRKKSVIGVSHVEYLGHVIGADGTKLVIIESIFWITPRLPLLWLNSPRNTVS